MLKFILKVFIAHYADILLAVFYKNNIWKLREVCKSKNGQVYKEHLYFSYLKQSGAWIGLGAQLDSPPILPHGLQGIFISNNAVIGRNVVIFHQVTIGSNSLKDSKGKGSPIIGDNCYIGCGAKIIGSIALGDNVRVGANCIVTKTVPSNSVCVLRGLDIIQKDNLDNEWIPVRYK